METGNFFVHLVRQMREVQKDFFLFKKSKDLKKAKQLEKQVDEFLEIMKKKEKKGE